MAARRHLCCFIDDDLHEVCSEIATRALCYYKRDEPHVYACPIHAYWLPSQWNRCADPIYYNLDGGFDTMINSPEEIDDARKVLVRAGVICRGMDDVTFER